MEAGNIDKAIAILSKLSFPKESKKDRALSVLSYGTLCHCYLRLEDTENAQKVYNLYTKAVAALKTDDHDAYNKELLEQEVLGGYLRFLQGNGNDTLAILEKAMIEYPTSRQQVNAGWMAALVCLKKGETDKAKDLLAYVSENGKGLWAKDRARETLDKIA